MDIQVGPESSISTPAAGYRTLFIDTDKNNRLYYKLPDGTFESFTGASSGDIEDIASSWMCALNKALDCGMITATSFQDIVEQGLTVNTNTVTDQDTGDVSTTITVGSRTILLISLSLDATTYTGAALATHQIVATFNPTTASNQELIFASSNPSKATVSSTGLITLVATGSATISVIPKSDPSKVQFVAITVT